MSKRGSGPPRRPRNPVAKAVRSPAFRMQVVPDKRWHERLRQVEHDESPTDAEEPTAGEEEKADPTEK